MADPVGSEIAEVDRTPVDPEALLSSASEQEHLRVAYDLTRETTALVGLAGAATEDPQGCWTVEEAVIGGQVVRLFRLLRALLEQVRASRAEIGWVISRMIMETVINIRFFLKHNSPELVASYLHQSLQHEVKLKQLIESNISKRDGEVQAIEARMLRSIDRDFRRSGVDPESIPKKRIRNWGGKSLFEKAQELGEEQTYLSLFGAPSRVVHGNWHDLLQHSLEFVEGCGFRPRMEDRPIRPQMLHAAAVLSAEAALGYLERFDARAARPLRERLEELLARARMASDVHDEWLSPARVEERKRARNGG